MLPSFFRNVATVGLLTLALWAIAACSNPLSTTDDPAEATTGPTSTVQASPTRAAMMPIVTPTPIPAGATVPAPDQPGSGSGEANPDTYVVSDGDTLYAIALRFGVEIRAIIELNALSDPNDIRVGQELQIPPRP
jgi:LysM repeat protein